VSSVESEGPRHREPVGIARRKRALAKARGRSLSHASFGWPMGKHRNPVSKGWLLHARRCPRGFPWDWRRPRLVASGRRACLAAGRTRQVVGRRACSIQRSSSRVRKSFGPDVRPRSSRAPAHAGL
jgi:hypothetical protein